MTAFQATQVLRPPRDLEAEPFQSKGAEYPVAPSPGHPPPDASQLLQTVCSHLADMQRNQAASCSLSIILSNNSKQLEPPNSRNMTTCMELTLHAEAPILPLIQDLPGQRCNLLGPGQLRLPQPETSLSF